MLSSRFACRVDSRLAYTGNMKETEYSGSDTTQTRGIQPPPHEPLPFEQLRLLAATDPADPESSPETLLPPE